ncbi:hypothetical protein DFH27DRAFT_190316 [Peziza echinospora]|nr:hypothetical protein DFH27DRAFT_190316 [Peziza echinospora]
MPSVLLPNTASPFSPRSPPTVVLNRTVEPWLTATLKRINRVKRPLNSAPQHMRCLTESLSSITAIWNLCSLIVSRAPESQLVKLSDPLAESLQNTTLLHIQAYVVHVDLVLSHEVAFKLSEETIKKLVDFHKNIYMVDQDANTWQWTEKDTQVKKLHEEFVQTVNRFVFRTDAIALEGIEDDGAGELLCGRSEEVKTAVLGFFLPLLPPPPRVVEPVRPPPTVLQIQQNSPGANWWAPTLPSSHLPAVEPWKVIPSSPASSDGCSPLTSTAPPPAMAPVPQQQNMWALGLDFSTAMSPPMYTTSTSQSYYQSSPLIPQLPLPSSMTQQCGPGVFGFGWSPFQDFTTI